MRLTTDQVNYVNVGLMLAACVAAFLFPFELFLFSYAVLGPLHYLTEISWLHNRNYYTHEKRANRPWLLLVCAAMAAVAYGLLAAEVLKRPVSPKWEVALFYLVFLTAGAVALFSDARARVLAAALGLAVLALSADSRYFVLVAFFIATIVHVLVFTGAFIFFGALKGRSRSGHLSLAVFVACVASFFLYAPASPAHAAGAYVRESYRTFNALNAELIKLFGLGAGATAAEIYDSGTGLTVMRLIAFAYTYHYLNWFSKTSVIGWHEVSRRRAAVIVAAWLASLALYALDYDTGMMALYLLSILHVMLEFPLNHRTLAGIGRELYALAR
jgi:hypothetical protein